MTMFRSSSAVERAKIHLENIKFSHSIFAMPFALAGALLAVRDRTPDRYIPDKLVLFWIILCVVAARTCAMAANRVADAAIDAKNPRTTVRPIPAGQLAKNAVIALGTAAAAVFIVCAFLISPLCGWLSPAVLFVLVGYSFTKRFTSSAHVALGLALGLAPAGAWLAIQGDFRGKLATPILLGCSVLVWVAGFDIIYACQDVEFDRRSGLHSIPAKVGIRGALILSAIFHAVAVALFVATGASAGLGWIYYITVGAVALLLVYEHWIVRPTDLSRVDAAFFTLNGWVSIAFLLGLILDLSVRT